MLSLDICINSSFEFRLRLGKLSANLFAMFLAKVFTASVSSSRTISIPSFFKILLILNWYFPPLYNNIVIILYESYMWVTITLHFYDIMVNGESGKMSF